MLRDDARDLCRVRHGDKPNRGATFRPSFLGLVNTVANLRVRLCLMHQRWRGGEDQFLQVPICTLLRGIQQLMRNRVR